MPSTVARFSTRRAVGLETRIVRPFRMAEHLGGARELAVVADRERHHAVLRLIGGVGHDARMAVAEPAAALAGHQYVGGDVHQHGERRLVERDLDLLPLAGALPRVERGEDRIAGQHAGADIDDGDAVLGRPAVRLTADAHQAGLGLQDEVVAGQRGLRPARTVAGDRAAHHARRVRLEPGVGEAPFVERTELEIVDQDVGLADQTRPGFSGRRRPRG